MKFRSLLFLSLVSIVVLIAATYPFEDSDKDKVLIQAILSGIGQMHYQPLEVDDDFSERVYDLYVDRMDGTKLFFLQEDIEKLETYKHKIDDEVSLSSFEFFDISLKMLKQRHEEAQAIYKEILAKPFNFSKDEQVNLDEEKKTWATNEKELKNNWHKILKYRALTRIVDNMEKQEKAKEEWEEGDEELEEKSFKELEKEAREKELKIHDDWFERLGDQERRDHLEAYLNAIASANDPHTNYLAPQKKQNFDINMSGRLEGIGARLSLEDDEIKVVSIVPGSASWRQKELEMDDIILKVGQGEEEPVDVVGMRLDDAVQLIRGKKGTEVRLTVKKVDGTTKVIPIIRDIVVLDESYAKSAVVDYKEMDKKVGFISLPKFYADFTKTGGRNCYNDVKQELAKLNEEGVDGIILDLRNNGGGSLNDVVKMAGLFIEKGPIVQVKSKTGAPRMKEDRDSEIQYNGPLVIMVNSGSASASEILAAAMQDYERAVIVGSATTFGKGTVQRFIDLDRAVESSFNSIKPLGSVKLTTQKFYRIDGTTTQLQGVKPDIILPDRYTYIDRGEKEHEYPLEWDEIEPADYKKTGHLKNLKNVQKASAARIKGNKTWQLIEQSAKELKEDRDQAYGSLQFDTYRKEDKEALERAEKYKDMFEEIDGLNIQSLQADNEYIQADSARIARFEDWHKGLRKDVYLEETLRIMNDLIEN